MDAIRATNPSITVRTYAVDLGSLQSVRDGAAKVLAENPRIDVLINSAGTIFMGPIVYTVDGIERHFGICHVGHFLLTKLIWPALRASDEPRVINVTSLGHMDGTVGMYARSVRRTDD